MTCEYQQHTVYGCDEENGPVDRHPLTSGATEASTPQEQEQGRASQPTLPDTSTDDAGFVETLTQGGTLGNPYSPRPPVRAQQGTRAQKDRGRLCMGGQKPINAFG